MTIFISVREKEWSWNNENEVSFEHFNGTEVNRARSEWQHDVRVYLQYRYNSVIDTSYYIHGTNHSTHCGPSGIPNAHSHIVKNFMVEEWKTNLMSLAILLHLLCAQHVLDINISIFRSLRLCWWITTSVVLFSVRFAGFQPAKRTPPKISRTKAPTHNELRTRRPMW